MPTVPTINVPEDRIPYPAGTKVLYWHWEIAADGLRTGAAKRPTDFKGAYLPGFAGIVDTLDGKPIIRLIDDKGELTGMWEEVVHLEPLHMNESWSLPEPEPQRWFAEGVDPTKL